jgi:hypothetical protein
LVWGDGSGPRVARTFHRALALIYLIAFASLGAQWEVLIGSRGLLPVAETLTELEAQGVEPWQHPTLFWLDASDPWLERGITWGLSLSVLALLGVLPRLCLMLLVPLYLSYLTAGESFFSFQWDILLTETGFLAIFLPRWRPAPLAHLAMRALCFKLYFLSGLAKLQSYLLDWHDGSAMTFYYETAPIPGPLAWEAHHLPAWWHHAESWFALGFELFGAWLLFGPRMARLVALGLFTAFQLLNLATANYGFFAYLALALHLFLLDESDLLCLGAAADRLVGWLGRRLEPIGRAWTAVLGWRARWHDLQARLRLPRLAELGLATAVATAVYPLWLVASFCTAAQYFSIPGPDGDGWEPAEAELRCLGGRWLLAPGGRMAVRECLPRSHGVQALLDATQEAVDRIAPYHLASPYHLFGHITRERVEPQIETLEAGTWTEHHFHYKPGPLDRAPPLVAPHQPRVDFLLWFYGLSFRRGMPRYVQNLLTRACLDPEAVAPLFVDRLPPAPEAVRIGFWRYHFTTPEEAGKSGHIWKRERVGTLRPLGCAQARKH